MIFWAILGWALCQDARADTVPAAPRARVVIAENPGATSAFKPRQEKVNVMMNRAILKLSGKSDLAQAWRSYVSTQDVVGIKVFSGPGPNSGTRPAVVAAIIEGLLKAGLPSQRIIIWDRQLTDLRLAGFDEVARRYKTRLAGSASSGYDDKAFYDNSLIGNLVAGDLEFDRNGTKTGRKSYVTKLLTGEITKIIIVSPLLNHNQAGVCGTLYSLAMGSVDNWSRFEGEPGRLAAAVPEIYALPALSDHVVLCVIDALIGQYQGEQLSLLHYSTELNQIWVSKDPVALDMMAVQELDRERQASQIPSRDPNLELYQNAGLLELGSADPQKVKIEKVK